MDVAVTVSCIDLSRLSARATLDLAVLSCGERARHAQFRAAAPARAFAATRIALRELLANRIGCSAASVRFGEELNGKPVLEAHRDLHFNVSHCDACALIAICESAQVGVDVERASVSLHGPVVESVGTPREMAWIRGHASAGDRTPLSLWTRKEAVLKACGIGLLFPPSDLELGAPDATNGNARLPGFGLVGWRDVALPFDAIGCVAVVGHEASGIQIKASVDATRSLLRSA